jgi:peptide/nickel transport system substrate-binding protein
MKKRFVVLALFLASCGGPVGKDQERVLHRRLEGDPQTLNPLISTSDPENVVIALLQRGLLDYDEKLNLVPGLAESVEADESRLVYTVKLREGVRWEDGTPVSSDDVKATLEALVDPMTPALYRRSFFADLEKVETPDARTARVTFRRASASQRDAFNLPLLPARLYRGTDVAANPANRKPLATGPFRLASWEGGTIRLVRNTQYFGEPPAWEQVVLRVVPESTSAFQGLLTGALDESRLNAVQRKEAAKEPAIREFVYDEIAYTYLAWNNRLPQFADPRVRRALTMLIDREAIAKTLYGGLARPANGPLPPGLWPYDPTLAPLPHDPAKAAALLDEAGWKKGKDGVRSRAGAKLAFSLSFGGASDRQRQIVELAQRSFKEAGVEIALAPMEWGAFVEKVDTGDYEACSLSLNLDPNPDLRPNWHSSQVPPNGMNHAFYRNPRADALMDELATTFDREKAKTLYAEVQRVIAEDQPFSFLHTVSVAWGVRDRVTNVKTSPVGLWLFWPGAAGWQPARAAKPI